VNGDNQPDLLIGASYAGTKYGGAVYVFLGGSDFSSPSLTFEGEKAGDNFGQEILLPGDITADGTGDIVISASYSDAGGIKNAGSVYVYKGGSVISKTPVIVLTGKAEDENFGYSLAVVGDMNGDKINDFGVGSLMGGPHAEGEALVFAGGPAIRNTPFLTILGANPKDMTGRGFTGAGDLNRDGYSDIMVGSPYSDNGYYRNGRIDVYLGGPSADEASDYHINGEASDTQCGFSLLRVEKFFGAKGDLFIFGCPGAESGFADFASIVLYR
jgi:hypothetical protein